MFCRLTFARSDGSDRTRQGHSQRGPEEGPFSCVSCRCEAHIAQNPDNLPDPLPIPYRHYRVPHTRVQSSGVGPESPRC